MVRSLVWGEGWCLEGNVMMSSADVSTSMCLGVDRLIGPIQPVELSDKS